MSNIELSIIIVSFNTRDLLDRCLKNLYAINIKVPFEVIVIDNASMDGSAEMVETHYPDVRLIKNTDNLLFARASNQGADSSSGHYFFFLNSDAFPRPDSIERMIEAFAQYGSSLACVGPLVLNANGSLQSEGHPFPSIHQTLATFFGVVKWPIANKFKGWLLPRGYHRYNYGVARRVDWIGGCSMLMRADVWKTLGGFDPDLYFYREDIEWPYRAMKNGFITRVVPGAEIVHIGGQSSGTPASLDKRIALLKGQKHFYKVTQGLTYHFFNNLLIVILYPLPYLICRMLKMSFYANAAKRNILGAMNSMRIITSRMF